MDDKYLDLCLWVPFRPHIVWAEKVALAAQATDIFLHREGRKQVVLAHVHNRSLGVDRDRISEARDEVEAASERIYGAGGQ